MKLFECQSCGNVLYFENRTCEQCNRRLGYMPERQRLAALDPTFTGAWQPLLRDEGPRVLCANAYHDACNWLAPRDHTEAFCIACRHNDIIRDISDPVRREAWRKLEFAKHRLFYSLLRWRLPIETRAENPTHGLIFRFLDDSPVPHGPKVVTGHDDGIITIALAEADDAEREVRRTRMGEPYRTLLGHFRHEIGHYYWDILVRDQGKLDACRAIFGNDEDDYAAALQRHYSNPPNAGWQNQFVSAYASAHPWEDFAETWAHHMLIVDTLEMGGAFGIEVKPAVSQQESLEAQVDFDPYAETDFSKVVKAWLPFSFAMNCVSRAMGQSDLYPFVLTPPVLQKLEFVHRLIHHEV